MAEQGQEKVDRRGTFWDWPVGVIVAGLAFVLFTRAAGTFIGLALMAFGAVALLIRRGAFSPRQ
jgi:hypothetical protein